MQLFPHSLSLERAYLKGGYAAAAAIQLPPAVGRGRANSSHGARSFCAGEMDPLTEWHPSAWRTYLDTRLSSSKGPNDRCFSPSPLLLAAGKVQVLIDGRLACAAQHRKNFT